MRIPLSTISMRLLALCLLIAACDSPRTSADLNTQLDTLAANTAGSDVPGVLIYLDSPAGQYTAVAGVADLSAQTQIDGGATLRLGSITKTYMAALTINLAQADILQLDAPISRYLAPDIIAQLPVGLDPTITQLLNHTSGIPDYYSERFYTEDWTRTEPLTPSLTLHAIRGLPATITPGTKFDYSNTNYQVLALIIESVTDRPIASLLDERIFEPLSLTETYYSDAFPPGDTIHGYGSPLDPWEDTFAFRENSGPDGGMFATASDVAIWIRALFSENGEFSETGRIMTDNPVRERQRKEQGLGVEILTSRSGETVYGHTGAIDGYLSAAFYIPSADAVLVIHINRSDEGAFSTLLSQALRLVITHSGAQ